MPGCLAAARSPPPPPPPPKITTPPTRTSAAFAPVTAPGVNLALPKLGFVLLNLLGVGIVAWKLRAMGLLPVTSADWVSLLPARHAAEFSAGAVEVG